ncbi:MAG: HEAT repeat domain-containing protein [Candidatus Marinimicrobia bacterium]|nr:HEAT repeat domain-containing protein [Candidatus Neomarinimicrobiota bacterium]
MIRRKLMRCVALTACLGSLFQISSARLKIISPRQNHATSFAIIIDNETFERTEKAVLAYRDAIESDGLSTYVVTDQWNRPEEVKTAILQLTRKKIPLEGVVFIGDIPIPMIRDAQHLASAFKMDQDRYPFIRSSIPSDRFYDDFDLKFKFIRQDTTNLLLFYYSLTAESEQVIHKDIYSARIKAPVSDASKYRIIEKYLWRVSQQKSQQETLDNILTYTGHGYHSEALSSWEGEILSLREQFAELYSSNGNIRNFYHSMSTQMKGIMLNELQQPKLDVALIHAHGATDTQYLIGYPPAQMIDENISAIQMFLRSKLREAKRRKKSIDETKKYYQESYQIPDEWFEGAFVDSVILSDSVYSAKLDIYTSDVDQISPQAEVIMFDECFNGAFQESPYIAGSYVFGNGTTVVGIANTVNVKQDIWANKHLGILKEGVRVGEWHRTRNYLESHLIGDPTFHFASRKPTDLPQLAGYDPKQIATWQILAKNDDVNLRAFAIFRLMMEDDGISDKELAKLAQRDPSFIVRLSALKGLATRRSLEFEDLLPLTANDSYELIRRFSMQWMGVVGREDYLPILVEKMITDPSERVKAAAKSAIEEINPNKALNICLDYVGKMPKSDYMDDLEKNIRFTAERSDKWLNQELIPNLLSDTVKVKGRLDAIRTFRNYQFTAAIPGLMTVASNPAMESQVRIAALESLGWFVFSYQHNQIIAACESIRKTDRDAGVKAEALKTRNRILVGMTDPVNP